MSAVSADAWQEVISCESSSYTTRDFVEDTSKDLADKAPISEMSDRTVFVSPANVGGGGLWLRVQGGLMMFFVVSVWVLGVLSPLIAVGLMWHGGRYAYTALGGLIAVIVYPYLADVENDATAKSSESSEGGQPSDTTKDKRVGRRGRQQQAAGRTGSWPAFRHAVPDWGQHWHKSCGRIYEVEWPDNWGDMDPTIFCYHPHGIFTQGYILNGSMNREMPKVVGLLATSLYHAPIFRLVFGRWAGSCAPASKQEFLKQIKQGSSFGLIPGGFQEAAISKLGTDRIWIRKRKGFVKYALQYGYRLRPVFTYGECNAYWNIQGCWPFRLWLTSKDLPGVLPWGVWWCPLLPRRCRLMTVFGTPIALPKVEEPSKEDVDKWHAVYVEELIALYERHKKSYASNPHGKLEIW